MATIAVNCESHAMTASRLSGLHPGSARHGREEWLSLTSLGRSYGMSAVRAGRILCAAGLRTASGEPTSAALASGLAQQQHPAHHHQALWHRLRCAPHLETHRGKPQTERTMVSLWADLLSALQQGCPWIDATVEEMASDIPGELVSPVNEELLQRGCDFQVRRPLRKAAAPRPACSHVPADSAADPHPCG
jgi:hypothetical protein